MGLWLHSVRFWFTQNLTFLIFYTSFCILLSAFNVFFFSIYFRFLFLLIFQPHCVAAHAYEGIMAGRPSIDLAPLKDVIISRFQNDMTAEDISAYIHTTYGINVEQKTIRRRLLQWGVRKRRA